MSAYAHLDGGGSFLKRHFADKARRLNLHARHAFEWCAGMGEIGLHLLERGMADRLTLADINPEAVAASLKMAERTGLGDRVDHFISDNLQDVPPATFDLVVSNPPNYANIQWDHPLAKKGDLRPYDRDWAIHEEFYRTIGHYLAPGATLLITEVAPLDAAVEIGGRVYDARPAPAIDAFARMWRENGFTLASMERLDIPEFEPVGVYMLEMKRAKP